MCDQLAEWKLHLAGLREENEALKKQLVEVKYSCIHCENMAYMFEMIQRQKKRISARLPFFIQMLWGETRIMK